MSTISKDKDSSIILNNCINLWFLDYNTMVGMLASLIPLAAVLATGNIAILICYISFRFRRHKVHNVHCCWMHYSKFVKKHYQLEHSSQYYYVRSRKNTGDEPSVLQNKCRFLLAKKSKCL